MKDALIARNNEDAEVDDYAIVLFDGICNLCNSSVNFIIDRDKHNRFKFAALQSDAAVHHIGNSTGLEKVENSIVLIQDGKAFHQSTAALRIARQLSGLWPVLYIFILVPPFIRDGVYSWIARNRYSFFGKTDTCRVPTPELRDRFIE